MGKENLLNEFIKNKGFDKEFKLFEQNQKWIGKKLWINNSDGVTKELKVIKVHVGYNGPELTCSGDSYGHTTFHEKYIDDSNSSRNVFSKEIDALKFEKTKRQHMKESYEKWIIREDERIEDLDKRILERDK